MPKLPGRADTRVTHELTEHTAIEVFFGYARSGLKRMRCQVTGCGVVFDPWDGGGMAVQWPTYERHPTSEPFVVCPAHLAEVTGQSLDPPF